MNIFKMETTNSQLAHAGVVSYVCLLVLMLIAALFIFFNYYRRIYSIFKLHFLLLLPLLRDTYWVMTAFQVFL